MCNERKASWESKVDDVREVKTYVRSVMKKDRLRFKNRLRGFMVVITPVLGLLGRG